RPLEVRVLSPALDQPRSSTGASSVQGRTAEARRVPPCSGRRPVVGSAGSATLPRASYRLTSVDPCRTLAPSRRSTEGLDHAPPHPDARLCRLAAAATAAAS